MLLSRHILRCRTPGYLLIPARFKARRLYSSKISKPLRILFCGSDAFSSASLRALHQEQQADPEGVKSIDVLCRPGKRTGRALKVIREVPIKRVAQELGLKIHERDTFTGWAIPRRDGEPINLIIAVSFGLFIPPRILNSAEYGGLNVHPSVLPQYRGASPLQYTIMNGAPSTGVTLQTLHPKSFDHGQILSQTASIPVPPNATFDELLALVAPAGAKLLAEGIRNRTFVPPANEHIPERTLETLVHATKTTPADREVNWYEWDAISIARRYRALGPLWNLIALSSTMSSNTSNDKLLRVRYEDIEEVEAPEALSKWEGKENLNAAVKKGDIKIMVCAASARGSAERPEQSVLVVVKGDDGSVVIGSRGKAIRVREMTIEGKRKMAASLAVESLKRDDLN